MQEEGMLAWKKKTRQGEEVWQVYQKFYLENRTKAPGNLWNDIEGNKKATRDIRNLFDSRKVFDFPKPIGFLKKALQIGSNPNAIILDFFSGSATTAHAVMQLNAEDGGNKKFIMVQLPEKTDRYEYSNFFSAKSPNKNKPNHRIYFCQIAKYVIESICYEKI